MKQFKSEFSITVKSKKKKQIKVKKYSNALPSSDQVGKLTTSQ